MPSATTGTTPLVETLTTRSYLYWENPGSRSCSARRRVLPWARISIYDQARRAIGEHLVQIYLCGINTIGQKARYHANLRSFRGSGTPGYRSSNLSRILDTLHYVGSRRSRLIQATDLVTRSPSPCAAVSCWSQTEFAWKAPGGFPTCVGL